MELESNFEFISPDAIRVKGTRVGIEIIIEDYLEGYSPEEIVSRYFKPHAQKGLRDNHLLPLQPRKVGRLY